MKKIYYKPSVSIFSIETGSFMAGSYTGEARAKSSPTEMFDDLHLSDNRSGGIKIFGRMKQIILTTSGLMKGRNLNKAHPIFRVM